MKMNHNMPELKANLGLLVRGEYGGLCRFLEHVQKMADGAGVQLVFQQVSASRLWIKEGDEMNDDKRL
jgi:hypothetical protein